MISLVREPVKNVLAGQKFNIPFGYHLLTVSLTVDKQTIILVKEILTIPYNFWTTVCEFMRGVHHMIYHEFRPSLQFSKNFQLG